MTTEAAHPQALLARIRESVEPALANIGFTFESRNQPDDPSYLYVDFFRPGELFRLSWDRRESSRFIGFLAEWISGETSAKIAMVDLRDIVSLRGDELTAALAQRADSFALSIRSFLQKLQAAARNQ